MNVVDRLEEAKVVFDAWVKRVRWLRVGSWRVGPGRWETGQAKEFPLVQTASGFVSVRVPFTCYTINVKKVVSNAAR